MLGSCLSDLVMGVWGGVVGILGTMASFEWQLWGGGVLLIGQISPVNPKLKPE